MLLIIVVFTLIISVLEISSMAYDWKSKIDSTYNSSKNYETSSIAKSAENVMGSAITIVQVVASGVAIVMLIVLAMKYIMASAGDRAEIKKHAVVYVVGAVILFGVTGVLGIIANFAESI